MPIDYKKDWDELAELDPLWAIATNPEKKFGKWDKDEFFQSGEKEIEKIISQCKNLGYPSEFQHALDFGCGVGRLTIPLSKNFVQCVGVDISETMIKLAKKYLNSPNCKYMVNSDKKLSMFENDSFDLIYSSIVLQHVPEKELIKSYLSEFIRLLKKNGILVFQLPSRLPIKQRIRLTSGLYHFLRGIGLKKEFIYKKIGVNPIVMNSIPETEVSSFLEGLGAKILKIQKDNRAGKKIESNTYFVTK